MRKSNIELLRIVAMFMILVILANMISLSRPTSAELIANPLATTTRYFIESLGIVGVDIFVMLSGWFLIIKTRRKSFLSFGFQIITLWGGAFLLFLILGREVISPKNLGEVFAFTRWDWFIKAYIVLMIIAPVLNTFIYNSPEKLQRQVLIGFFIFSCSYGWLGGANRFFVNGYGPLLFIGIYLLSQYVHHASEYDSTPTIIRKFISLDKKYDLMVFLGCITLNTTIGLLGLFLEKNIYGKVYAYTNPFTIIAALYLLLYFSKLEMGYNKIVNKLAAGSFAVYLIHSQVNIRPFFNKGVQYLYSSYNGINCILSIFIFLVLVYIFSVVIDIPRLWMWNILSKKYNIK